MRIPALVISLVLVSSLASAQTPLLSIDKATWWLGGMHVQPVDLDGNQATREALRFRQGDDGRILISVQTFASGGRFLGCIGADIDPWEMYRVSPNGNTEWYLHLDFAQALRSMIVQGEWGYHELGINLPQSCVSPPLPPAPNPAPVPPFIPRPAPLDGCRVQSTMTGPTSATMVTTCR